MRGETIKIRVQIINYLDQQMHDILTVTPISLSIPTCFEVFTSSSEVFCIHENKLPEDDLNNSKHVRVHYEIDITVVILSIC